MSTSSSSIAKTYYRRSSLPQPSHTQYFPLPAFINTGYAPTLQEYRNDQRIFGLNFRRYQPKTLFYDSKGPMLDQKTRYDNKIDKGIKEQAVSLKEEQGKRKIRKKIWDENIDKIIPETKSKYEKNVSYVPKYRCSLDQS